jgi:hypothetical protein
MSTAPASPDSPSLSRWWPWLLVVSFALGAGWFYLEARTARQEADSLRLQVELRELELRDARNRGAAERLILERQIEAGRSPAATKN